MTKKLLLLFLALVLAIASCGGSDDGGGDSGDEPNAAPDVAAGASVFENTCVACHGPAGKGIDNLGKPMPGSTFINSLSDDELIEFIKVGRDTEDPANTTGVNMPARGGNPNLDEQDLINVVAYIRTLS